MPRSPQLNARMREATREKLLAAALAAFARHGYGGASLRSIAAEAGVSPGAVYLYFQSKEGLLHELFARSMADVRASFAAAQAEPDPTRRLETLVRVSFAIIRRNLVFWRLSYGVRMQAAVLETLQPAIGEWTAEIERTLARYVRAAGVANAATEARVLFAMMDGVAQHYALDPDNYPLERVIDQMLRRYG
jgi:AcrR family transcriptional regulator